MNTKQRNDLRSQMTLAAALDNSGWPQQTLQLLDMIDALNTELAKATNHIDLMVDEFRRIKSCLHLKQYGEAMEIRGLCDRAIKKTYQHIDVIVQRDNAEAQLTQAKADLDEIKAAARAMLISVGENRGNVTIDLGAVEALSELMYPESEMKRGQS